jgi:hypothetical protein
VEAAVEEVCDAVSRGRWMVEGRAKVVVRRARRVRRNMVYALVIVCV